MPEIITIPLLGDSTGKAIAQALAGLLDEAAVTVTGITAAWDGTIVYAGGMLDVSHIVVTASYSDGSQGTVRSALCQVTGSSVFLEGANNYTISYDTASTAMTVTALAASEQPYVMVFDYPKSNYQNPTNSWAKVNMQPGTYSYRLVAGGGGANDPAYRLEEANSDTQTGGTRLLTIKNSQTQGGKTIEGAFVLDNATEYLYGRWQPGTTSFFYATLEIKGVTVESVVYRNSGGTVVTKE